MNTCTNKLNSRRLAWLLRLLHTKRYQILITEYYQLFTIKALKNNPLTDYYLFVTIHPYVDGNGRTARLLMNYFFLSSGYSWLTIRADQRTPYFNALETANTEHNILPFGKFIVGLLEKI